MRHEPIKKGDLVGPSGRIEVLTLGEAKQSGRWEQALASQRKDHRYYEIVERALRQDFDYRYFAMTSGNGAVGALVPFFLLELDLLAGTRGLTRRAAALLRRLRPGFMRVRSLMVGCAAGEGHLDDPDALLHSDQAAQLADATLRWARRLGARIIVFKEFPAGYRNSLDVLRGAGFTRIPSLPAAALNIDYPSFDAFMACALSRRRRKDLRCKFHAAEAAAAIELVVTSDVTPIVDEIYPLYLQVFERAEFRFEKLTKDYLREIGRRMPDRARFFVWRQQGRVVAFSLCMVQGTDLFGEYLGFDYRVALDIHLYHYVLRDVISWGIANGYRTFHTNGSNYDPKLHLRFALEPVDLYVRHVSPISNAALSRLLPLLEPTHFDPALKRFPNCRELWG